MSEQPDLIFEILSPKLIFENLSPKLIFDVLLEVVIGGVFDSSFDSTFN